MIELYLRSAREAVEGDELELWRDSYNENLACKEAIEEAIRQNFDGLWLKDDCVQPMLDRFGADRLSYVLANTIQQKSYDGRFSQQNKMWAQSVNVAKDGSHSTALIVSSHPAVLDGFTHLFREVVKQEQMEKNSMTMK